MNPVTRGLLKQLHDRKLNAFVEAWDSLETLIVEIYKQKSLSFTQQEEFFSLQEELRKQYKLQEGQLAYFWSKTKVKGEPVTQDPFAALIETPAAKSFVENWDAMRTLPLAREALNQMLMARIEKKAS